LQTGNEPDAGLLLIVLGSVEAGNQCLCNKPVGAAEGCDLLILIELAFAQHSIREKIESYGGLQAGKRIPNVLVPWSLCTNTSPPCISAIALTMANPSPWLAPLLLREASTR